MSAGETFFVGLDLGTTHCALASFDAKQEVPQALEIPQVVAPSEVASRLLLPSFLYLPVEGEFAADALNLPWQEQCKKVVGEFARTKGATTPSRVVASAKSWLCHAAVDRKAAILPWGAPEEVPKVSPLEASAEYLSHLRQVWDRLHPEAPLAQQELVLTIPASFDAVARELTVEAAELAGLGASLRLLEEPQAALYDWVAQSQGRWREQVQVGDRILVVDIGGGTTDFSLIAVNEREGELELERVAVGNHILLGGDNMDLALAYSVRARLEGEGTKLDDWQMQALTHACRGAKEKLLAEDAPEQWPLVIPGRSSRLIGGSIRTQISGAEVQAVLLDGFFPEVPADAKVQNARRMGLSSVGLPYATDAGISRHLASFLSRAVSRGSLTEGQQVSQLLPSAVLFNGGVLRSSRVQKRLLNLLQSWAQAAQVSAPQLLEGSDAELAVSRGAAFYARSRSEGGLRIRSGSAQSHYIGIERAELAIPGVEPRIDAVCVAPMGMEEGSELSLQQSFSLWLGEEVSFRFFASSDRASDVVGSVVDPSLLNELSPIETMLEGQDGEVVQVQLHAAVTESGSLEISAVEEASSRRWKLSFNIRAE